MQPSFTGEREAANTSGSLITTAGSRGLYLYHCWCCVCVCVQGGSIKAIRDGFRKGAKERLGVDLGVWSLSKEP